MPGHTKQVTAKYLVDSSSSQRNIHDELSSSLLEESERCLDRRLIEPKRQAQAIGSADIVVGIPFYNEADNITSVIQTVRAGLEEFYPGQKAIIVAVGSPVGGECLRVVREIPESESIKHLAFLLGDERINGKGWAICAAMEIAQIVNADLAIIEADLVSIERDGDIEGLAPDWIYLLLEPIKREKMDLVVSHFNRHYPESPISAQLVNPLLTAIYNCPIHDALGGQWGISHRLLHIYLQDSFSEQGAHVGSYGIDIWLATKAASVEARICESNLGLKIPGTSGKMKLMLHHVVETLFARISADRKWWTQEETVTPTFLLLALATFGTRKTHQLGQMPMNAKQLLLKYQQGINRFNGLYYTLLPDDTYQQLETLAKSDIKDFSISASLWADTINHFLLAFAFNKEFAKDDLISAFIPLFEGRLAGFNSEMQSLSTKLSSLDNRRAQELVSLDIASKAEILVDEFILQKQDLLTKWEINEETLKPPIPKVTYREFIPGVHLVVPLEVTSPNGNHVSANNIYEALFSTYRAEFENFIYGDLKVNRGTSEPQIVQQISEFLSKVEMQLDSALLLGDLLIVEETKQVVNTIVDYFHRGDVFALTPEMAHLILTKNPPTNLLTILGYRDLTTLLKKYDTNDVLALANWAEDQEYQEWVLDLLKRTLKPEHFQLTTLRPVVVDHEQFPSLVEMRECGGLCKLTGRVVVSNLRKGMGGQFPKLRYLSTIAKMIIEMERFGKIWYGWAHEVRNLGSNVVNSIEGHWGREPLSAHNIFENGHQRVLVQRMKDLANRIVETAGDNAILTALADNLQIVANSYHLAVTLPSGIFVPCSAWSWASYSAKGGVGIPTPFSLHVERDWSSRDFLVEFFRASGGKEEAVDEKIIDLMERGRECEDLGAILLGTSKEADAIIQMESVAPQQPPAGALIRYDGNPILKPIKEHPWESKYVLNPGAIRLEGKVYLVYRAVGDDNISRLGLATSEDGHEFTERLEKPIFEPTNNNEEKGCEDARLTLIGDRIYMLYTAYSEKVAQIGMASIEVHEFLNCNWQTWRRHGMVFPGFANKDGTLFPEQFDGKYAMLHRVDPHIWIIFSSRLSCPWPRKEHKILAGSTSGMLWDGRKIGGGSQPIKTRYGWLLITHGVDYLRFYRLGILLLDLFNPSVVIYRSPNAILEPQEKYEEGEPGADWVPNVVFTCGAVPREDGKETLEAQDELLVYYGAADSTIGVASAKISDLIPKQFR